MDTQTQVILFHGLSLAKKHFKPKIIEVMVATTPPLLQDRKLPRSTYRSVHVRACLRSKHVVEVIQVDLRISSLFLKQNRELDVRYIYKLYNAFINYYHYFVF